MFLLLMNMVLFMCSTRFKDACAIDFVVFWLIRLESCFRAHASHNPSFRGHLSGVVLFLEFVPDFLFAVEIEGIVFNLEHGLSLAEV